MIRALLTAALIAFGGAALAANPSERLSDPALEDRARVISKELRCLVCQNQSIDDSDAEMARDLRLLVRERLSAGDTNQEVFDYVTERYGAFVLLRPPMNAMTIGLWIAPIIVVLIAVGGAAAYLRSRRPVAADGALSAEEEAALEKILKERGDA
ncbi:MAG: cytochrome c-type biogenesis protein [Pseudomonadota bacterium]